MGCREAKAMGEARARQKQRLGKFISWRLPAKCLFRNSLGGGGGGVRSLGIRSAPSSKWNTEFYRDLVTVEIPALWVSTSSLSRTTTDQQRWGGRLLAFCLYSICWRTGLSPSRSKNLVWHELYIPQYTLLTWRICVELSRMKNLM